MSLKTAISSDRVALAALLLLFVRPRFAGEIFAGWTSLVLVERTGFIGKHDRNAVMNRIGETGLVADQLLALRVVAQRTLGQRANQDFQQLGIDRAVHFAFPDVFGASGYGGQWAIPELG